MSRHRQHRRLLLLVLVLGAAFAGLGWRLVDVQVIRHAEFRARADRAGHRTDKVPARRGEIRDRNGAAPARGRRVGALTADPALIPATNRAELARLAAPHLGLSVAHLEAQLTPRTVRRPDGAEIEVRSVSLARNFPRDAWDPLAAVLATNRFGFPEKLKRADKDRLRLLRRGISVDGIFRYQRDYPNGATAAAVIGHLDGQGAGIAGIERLVDLRMRGTDGFRDYVVNARGERIPGAGDHELPPLPGDHVYLTLDAGLQLIVEGELAKAAREHGSERACAVVVQPATGRVLAMASWPSFDPAAPLRSTNEIPARWNLATAWAYEPGSTFKVVTLAAALNEGLTAPGDIINCENGHWQNGRVTLSDDRGHRNALLPLEEMIARSSNIGTYKLALRLGPERLNAYLRAFGFGQRSGVNFPGESAGVMSPWPWGPVEFSRVSIGYTIAVTPLQLAMAMSALANDGRLLRPLLIDRLEAADGRVLAQAEPQVVREVCRPETAREKIGRASCREGV